MSGTRGFPIFSTLVVALAMAAMIALGFWQLGRRHEKEALLARFQANAVMPPLVIGPATRLDEHALFRRAIANCRDPGGWRVEAGSGADGRPGWRQIGFCRAEGGTPIAVDAGLGTALQPGVAWPGGRVSGVLAAFPTHQSLIGRIAHGPATPAAMLLVLDRAAPGLSPSAPPDPSAVPNNHLAYAGQWFFFAAVAGVIYALALRRRARG